MSTLQYTEAKKKRPEELSLHWHRKLMKLVILHKLMTSVGLAMISKRANLRRELAVLTADKAESV